LVEATLEHIIPLAFGGRWNIKNLALSCKDCNKDRDVADFEQYKLWRRGHLRRKPPTLLKDIEGGGTSFLAA
jgi:5-methylcytosine-specific restriction endonuclease McrA